MFIYFTFAILTILLMLYFFKKKYYELDHPTIIATIFAIILLLLAIVVGMLKSMVGLILVSYAAILFPESTDSLIPEKYIELAGWLGLWALLLVFCGMGVYLA